MSLAINYKLNIPGWLYSLNERILITLELPYIFVIQLITQIVLYDTSK